MELLITFIFLAPYIIIGILIKTDIGRLIKRRKRQSIEEVLKALEKGRPLDLSKIDSMILHKWKRHNNDLPFDM